MQIDIDLSYFDDDEMIDELVRRGYHVYDVPHKDDLGEAISAFQRHKIEDTLFYLEREIPELFGLHKHIKEN